MLTTHALGRAFATVSITLLLGACAGSGKLTMGGSAISPNKGNSPSNSSSNPASNKAGGGGAASVSANSPSSPNGTAGSGSGGGSHVGGSGSVSGGIGGSNLVGSVTDNLPPGVDSTVDTVGQTADNLVDKVTGSGTPLHVAGDSLLNLDNITDQVAQTVEQLGSGTAGLEGSAAINDSGAMVSTGGSASSNLGGISTETVASVGSLDSSPTIELSGEASAMGSSLSVGSSTSTSGSSLNAALSTGLSSSALNLDPTSLPVDKALCADELTEEVSPNLKKLLK